MGLDKFWIILDDCRGQVVLDGVRVESIDGYSGGHFARIARSDRVLVHGSTFGMLDIVDSPLVAAPLAYLFFMWSS